MITLKHPDLADHQYITVPEISVPHYRAAGWLPVDEKPEETITKSAPRKSRAIKE